LHGEHWMYFVANGKRSESISTSSRPVELWFHSATSEPLRPPLPRTRGRGGVPVIFPVAPLARTAPHPSPLPRVRGRGSQKESPHRSVTSPELHAERTSSDSSKALTYSISVPQFAHTRQPKPRDFTVRTGANLCRFSIVAHSCGLPASVWRFRCSMR